MTWSTFALFLARRTEFAFNIGHFLIILPFIAYWPLFKFLFLYIWSFLKPLFWMKQIIQTKGSKLMNTFMHDPSFFSFPFLSLSISFPKLTTFTILRLYMACKMRKITALTWEISSWRLVEKFLISAFPMYYSLNNWIGEQKIVIFFITYLVEQVEFRSY